MNVDIRIGAVGDPPLFPEYATPEHPPKPAKLIGVGIIEKGMESGSTSVGLFFQMDDRTNVIVQLSSNMMLAIAGAVRGAKERFGDTD